MAGTCPHRPFPTRAKLAAAAATLTLWVYFCGYVGVHWLHGRGVIGWRSFEAMKGTVFWPIDSFAQSSGGRVVARTADYAFYNGDLPRKGNQLKGTVGKPAPPAFRPILD